MDFIEPVHRMQLPREVLIGHGVVNRIDDLCRGLGFKSSILILTGPHVYDQISNSVIQSLESVGYHLNFYIVKESKFRYVKETLELITESKPEALLGIGGGKVIDVAKLAASNYGLPFISIPTAASHDGISSPRANIKDLEKPIWDEANLGDYARYARFNYESAYDMYLDDVRIWEKYHDNPANYGVPRIIQAGMMLKF